MRISLDISTSTTGWALWDNKTLVAAGAIETKTSEKLPDLFTKMDYVINELSNITQKHNAVIDCVIAEQALQKFSGGKTTAQTMGMLLQFNFCLVFSLTRRFGCKEKMIDVRSARKKLGIVIPKGAKDKKIFVIEKIKPMFPELDWRLKKTGKYKDWVGDMADAITAGLHVL